MGCMPSYIKLSLVAAFPKGCFTICFVISRRQLL